MTALNSTLWWSVALQRSRLDIYDHDQGTLRSTVTDPSGSGVGLSALIARDGTCSCSRFNFTHDITPYTYVALPIVNCSQQPDTVVHGTRARHWSIDALQLRRGDIAAEFNIGIGAGVQDSQHFDHSEYYAEALAPWPIRIITRAGQQEFEHFEARVPPLATFAPQACCSTDGRTQEASADSNATTDRINAPGAAAWYEVSGSAISDDLQVDHIWETLPNLTAKDAGGVFVSLGFWFENGIQGTFGTQVLRTGSVDALGHVVTPNTTHRVIISIPDAHASQHVGWSGEYCARYGVEQGTSSGIGSHCVTPYELTTGAAFNLHLERAGHNGTGDWWNASVQDVRSGGPPLQVGALYLPDAPTRGVDGPSQQGFGRLQTKAIARQQYILPTGCGGQALASVGLVGPWWSKAAIKPEQAIAAYQPNCTFADVGTCIYGAGCGPLRALFTMGGTTERMQPAGQPLWNYSHVESSGSAGQPRHRQAV